jgi:hypothetical protein
VEGAFLGKDNGLIIIMFVDVIPDEQCASIISSVLYDNTERLVHHMISGTDMHPSYHGFRYVPWVPDNIAKFKMPSVPPPLGLHHVHVLLGSDANLVVEPTWLLNFKGFDIAGNFEGGISMNLMAIRGASKAFKELVDRSCQIAQQCVFTVYWPDIYPELADVVHMQRHGYFQFRWK